MSLRTEYDTWHERLQHAQPDHDHSVSPWYQLVREYIGDVSGQSILEVACGGGGFVQKLSQAGAVATGCDFSYAALRAAHARLGLAKGNSSSFVQGDAQSLPFADSSFHAIISCETIEHLPRVLTAIKEMHRVTRPGGKLFLTTPNYFNFMGLYDFYARFRHPGRKDDQPFDRRQWFPQIRHWIRQAGWTILRSDGTVHQFPFFPGRNPVRWQALESTRALRRFLSPFAYTYFIAAQKLGGHAYSYGESPALSSPRDVLLDTAPVQP